MLEFAILGLLKERPMHGYDLRKRLRDDFGPLSNLSFGSLYPALARLEANGAIAAVPEVTEAGPAREAVAFTGSIGGERAATVARRATEKAAAALAGRGTRGRKVFAITPRGEELFEQLLESHAEREDPRGFTVRLAFARHLSATARVRLLERRRMELADRSARAGRGAEGSRRPLDRYEVSIAEHARDVMANELAWVERLLEEEQRTPTTPTAATANAGSRRSRDRIDDDHELTAATPAGVTHERGTRR